MFLPMMACRLMLSLKKGAYEPTGLWSLSDPGRVRPSAGTIQFVSPEFDTSHEVSDTLPRQTGGGSLELGPVPRPSQDRGSV